MKHNNKPSSVASEIKLKSACLFATKSDIDELDFSKSVCYAFVCKDALFSFEDVHEDINTIVTPTASAAIHIGPITRSRTRQLNYQILLFLGNDSNVHENMMLPKLDTFVLLTNEGPSLEKDEHWSKNKHGDDGMRKGNKNGVTSDDFRTLKPP